MKLTGQRKTYTDIAGYGHCERDIPGYEDNTRIKNLSRRRMRKAVTGLQ
jgi:hypothetical protein